MLTCRPHNSLFNAGLPNKIKRRLCVSRKTFTIPPSFGKRASDIPLSDLTPSSSISLPQRRRTGAPYRALYNDSSKQSFTDSEFSPWSVTSEETPEEASEIDQSLGSSGGDHDRRNSEFYAGVSEKLTLESIEVPNPRYKPPSRVSRVLGRIMTAGRSDGTVLGLTGKPLLYDRHQTNLKKVYTLTRSTDISPVFLLV